MTSSGSASAAAAIRGSSIRRNRLTPAVSQPSYSARLDPNAPKTSRNSARLARKRPYLRQRFHPLAVQGTVPAAPLAQLRRRPVLDHPPPVDDQHPVRDIDGGQTVGDDHRRPVAQQSAQRPLHETFRGEVA